MRRVRERRRVRAVRNLRDQRGSVLFATVLAMLLLSVLAVSLTMIGSLEGKIAVNNHAHVRAFHVAEGGIEGVRRELVDLVNANGWTGTWSPLLAARGTVCSSGNGVLFSAVPAGGASWNRTGSDPTLFVRDNDTSLRVSWENASECADTDGIITLRATGRVAAGAGAFGAERLLAVDVTWKVGGPRGLWDRAVSAGAGPPGPVVTGDAMVYGSVLFFDNGGGVVWDVESQSGVRNNYQNGAGAPEAERLRATTRALLTPTLLAVGDVSLNAELEVERGSVTFSGSGTAGLAQGSITDRKQTLDTALADDFDPGAVSAVHADRTGPVAGTVPGFPLLSDVVGGGDTRTWEGMLNQEGLHIAAGDLGGSAIDGSVGVDIGGGFRRFCRPLPCGTVHTSPGGVQSRFDLTIDQSVNPNIAQLVVQGIIVFDDFGSDEGLRLGGLTGGGPLSLGEIVYAGSAVVFVDDAAPANCAGAAPCAGRLTVAADVKTAAGAFPTAVNPPVYPPVGGTANVLGFMADRVGLGYGADGSSVTGVTGGPTHAALFYAQSQLLTCKGTEILGSLLSQVITVACQVPKVAAVKTMSAFLPAGMIGGATSPPGTLTVVRWREGAQ